MTSVTPDKGVTSGGTQVVISGDGFTEDIDGFSQVVAGESHNCALGLNNQAYCWGRNVYGSLGNGTYVQSLIPAAVTMPAGVSFSQITAGDEHTCALSSDNQAYCWGRDESGKLGHGGYL